MPASTAQPRHLRPDRDRRPGSANRSSASWRAVRPSARRRRRASRTRRAAARGVRVQRAARPGRPAAAGRRQVEHQRGGGRPATSPPSRRSSQPPGSGSAVAVPEGGQPDLADPERSRERDPVGAVDAGGGRDVPGVVDGEASPVSRGQQRRGAGAQPVELVAVPGDQLQRGQPRGELDERQLGRVQPRLRSADVEDAERPRRSTGRPAGRRRSPSGCATRRSARRPGCAPARRAPGRCRSRWCRRWPRSRRTRRRSRGRRPAGVRRCCRGATAPGPRCR